MRKRADMPVSRGSRPPRAEVLSELPLIAILLVAAVLVAALAAGGPILDVFLGGDALAH